jgi:transmembrane sensor
VCLKNRNTIRMTDDDFFNIWNSSDGKNISDSEIKYSFSGVMDEIRKIEEKEKPDRFGKLGRIFIYSIGVAAAVAVVAILSISVYRSKMEPKMLAAAEPVEYLEARSETGEIKNITLPDSSKITLNSGSLLIYPSRFAGSKRDVYLSGEAIFDVTHDDTKPFEVSTADFIVKVHGTKFNVSAYEEDQEGSTTLCRGSVSVTCRASSKEYYIVPNQRFSLSREGEVSIRDVPSDESISWANESLCFNSVPIRDMLRTLERRFGVEISLVSDKHDGSIITAKFIRGESLEDIMRALSNIVPELKWRRNGEGDIFIR